MAGAQRKVDISPIWNFRRKGIQPFETWPELEAMGLEISAFGASGNALFGGFGPGARVVKDAIKAGQKIPGNAGWQLLATELSGSLLQSDGPATFSYDCQTITAAAHIWVTVFVAVAIDNAKNSQFLALVFNGADYKSVVGFVGANAVTVFFGEMFPGDTLQIAAQSQQDANTIAGDFCFADSILPQ